MTVRVSFPSLSPGSSGSTNGLRNVDSTPGVHRSSEHENRCPEVTVPVVGGRESQGPFGQDGDPPQEAQEVLLPPD